MGGRLLYPATAMGSGFALFWVGFVVGHDLGLHAANALILGLIGAWAGVSLIVALERSDRGAPPD